MTSVIISGRRASVAASVAGLCVSSALLTAAMAVGSAAGTLVVGDQVGTVWAGAPSTAGIVGTGLGALALPRLVGRAGRRGGLARCYGTALLGAGCCAAGAATGSALGIVLGMLLLGVGNAAAQITRYLAGDLFPPERRGAAIAMVVFVSSVGAVGGPLTLSSSHRLAALVRAPGVAGAFLFCVAVVAAALLATATVPPGEVARVARVPLRALLASGEARAPLMAMAGAQVVMVAIMTAAPLELHRHNSSLGAIGIVLSAHTLGMFAVSPLTGLLIDRRGPRGVMLAGLCLALAASLLMIVSSRSTAGSQGIVLFVLGVAWNFAFVGGSTGLSRGVPADQRLAIEGGVDAAVWSLAALAGAASTALLAAGGPALLAGVAGTIALLAVVAASPAFAPA